MKKLLSHRAAVLLLAVAVIITCVAALPPVYRRFMQALYPVDYSEHVLAAAEEFSFPPSLLYAVIHTESRFRPDALSQADAKGLMQLTDDTFIWAMDRAGHPDKYTPADLFEPAVNIHYGTYVLSLFREQFTETPTLLAAYNAGQGRVTKWLQNSAYSANGTSLDFIPYAETRQYVQRVLQAQIRYQRLYHIP